MSDDDSFLSRILDDPEDIAPRLVYADWLEERGDIRGELIRTRTQLTDLSAKDHHRKILQQRERELAAECDPDWLVLLERADWKLRYRALEPTEHHKTRWAKKQQAKISAALKAFEGELGLKLPRSYKAYCHVFGHGEMATYFRLHVPCAGEQSYELAAGHRAVREIESEGWSGKQEWLNRAVFFGWTIGGEAIVWDTDTVTDPVAHEYRVCWLTRSKNIYRAADNFREFIDEICLKVFDDEGEPSPQEFNPYDL